MATPPITRIIPSPDPTQHSLPPAPFIAPVSGDIDQRLAVIAAEINKKADRVSAPTFVWVRLVSPNGTTWAVSVDDLGNLHTTQVLRS